MDLRGRGRGLDGSQWLEDTVVMPGATRHDVRVAGRKDDELPLGVELGPPGDDIADHLVVSDSVSPSVITSKPANDRHFKTGQRGGDARPVDV